MSFKQLIFAISTTFALVTYGKAPLQAPTLNDFSRLNETTINQLITPTSYQELESIIKYATAKKLKISIAGSKHSQGGHAFYPDAIVVDLKLLNNVLSFEPDTKLITVQTGITWKEIQDFLNPHNCAVKIMQFANLFTVGGSLSVNCNGVDPHQGPLIESVRSIKIMNAEGSIIIASRTENAELFHLAIGGLGLFGIIIEATLEVVDNDFYQQETRNLTIPEYVAYVKNLPHDPTIGFHFGFLKLNLFGKDMFSNIATFNFKKINTACLSKRQQKRYKKLYREKWVTPRTLQTKLWSKFKFIKAIHWIPESAKNGRIISRNNIMRPPASHLYVETAGNTNLLQEYFVPVDGLMPFIAELEAVTKKLNVNLMHVAVRYIPQNNESFLSYTTTDRIGIVLFFNQSMDEKGNQTTKQWTQHLINSAIDVDGTYYLPIQLHADNQQIHAAYPNITNFFTLKKQYDPHELFMNYFYQKYA